MAELYGVRMRIGGIYFEDTVLANSYEDAEAIAERMGGEVTGRVLDDLYVPTGGHSSFREDDDWG
jgi:hypothetical protein